ncbi:MAG: class III poly(R)-hydroxyalkanoic acid synthase subunit PhaE [Methylobacter sp.]|nr:class III poly(R)-hydroxyalkanoic acid synthase subunit PhaE [Methylobacter sp.]
MSTDSFSIVNDWLSFQKKYWETLSSFNPVNSSQKESTQQPFNFIENPWSDALQNWWKKALPAATPSVQDFFSQLMDQTKFYLQAAEHMNSAFQTASTLGHTGSQWQEAINKMLTGMKETFSIVSPDGQKTLHNWMGIGELPLENWQRIVSSLSVMPGDFFQGLNTPDSMRMKDKVQAHLDQFMSAPGLGHMRERQWLYQELYRLGVNYQTAFQEYTQFQNGLGLKSIDRFQSTFSNLEKKGMHLDSMRSVYDLWVDCCEEVYAESAVTDEYVALRGSLINALMALKLHSRTMVDEVLEGLNMPTKRELNTLHQRAHEQWRENKKMRNELASLKEQIAAISKPEPATPAKSKTPDRTMRAAPTAKNSEKNTKQADQKKSLTQPDS